MELIKPDDKSYNSNGEIKSNKDVKSIIDFEEKCRDQNKKKPIINDDEEEDMSLKTTSPKKDNPRLNKQEELECGELEMSEMKEENKRLKKMLEQMKDDYKSLEMRVFDILSRNQPSNISERMKEGVGDPETSLSLGIQSATKRKKEDNGRNTYPKVVRESLEDISDDELSLGLEFKFKGTTQPHNHIDLTDVGSERSNEMDDTCKVLKTNTIEKSEKHEDSEESNNPPKRARVSVRARCETPTMNDGCQWRKYGQKIAKGNPCPRAYYRCTVAPACPVRKQVQRCSEDMSILTTTYEGTHSHPLPVAATTMASTTSAAASILLSGSSTSSSTAQTANLNGLNFTLYNNNNSSKPGQINLQSYSSPIPPTITLDLTSNSSSHFTKQFTSNFHPSHKYSTSLDFSSSQPNAFPTIWRSSSSYVDYSSLISNKIQSGSINFGKSSHQEQMDRMTQSVSSSSSTSSQHILTETLTKVLTSDPSFQSVVAAAISTMVGSTNNNSSTNISRVNSEPIPQNLKWATLSDPRFSNRPSSSSSSNSQQPGSFMVLQPSFPFSLYKTSSTPDLGDHLK